MKREMSAGVGGTMYRSIETSMWSDPKIRALPTEGKLLFLYLITNNHAHVSGIYYLPCVMIGHETGLTERAVDTLFLTLSDTRLALRNAEFEVVWVVNMLRYQGSGEKIKQAVEHQLRGLHNCPLVELYLSYYKDLQLQPPQRNHPLPHTLSDTSPRARGQEQEQRQEQKTTARQAKPAAVAAVAAVLQWPAPECLVDLYNTQTPGDHPKVAVLSPQRRKKIQEYLRLFPDQTFWEQVCAEICASPWLRGQKASKDRRPIKRNLDWLLTKGEDGIENCVKVYEGKYRDSIEDQLHQRLSAREHRNFQATERFINAGIETEEQRNGRSEGPHSLWEGDEYAGRRLSQGYH